MTCISSELRTATVGWPLHENLPNSLPSYSLVSKTGTQMSTRLVCRILSWANAHHGNNQLCAVFCHISVNGSISDSPWRLTEIVKKTMVQLGKSHLTTCTFTAQLSHYLSNLHFYCSTISLSISLALLMLNYLTIYLTCTFNAQLSLNRFYFPRAPLCAVGKRLRAFLLW